MDDSQLIELLEHKTPEELSADELQLLRDRLPHSPALQRHLAEHLRLEECLSGALGGANLSVDRIITRAKLQAPPTGALARWGQGLAILLLLGFVGFVLALGVLLSPGDDPWNVVSLAPSEAPPPDPAVSAQAALESAQGLLPATPSESAAPEDDGPPVQLPVTLEAENFARGQNLEVESAQGEEGEVRFVHSGAGPGFAEYEVRLPAAGKLLLRTRYAAFQSRPLKLSINGAPADRPIAAQQTGGYTPQNRQWFDEGVFDFAAGKNVLRLETTGVFPHLDQLTLAEPPSAAPVTPPAVPPAAGEVAVTPPPLPWTAAVEGPATPFAQSWSEDFDYAKALPTQPELEQWFAAVPGHTRRFSSYTQRNFRGVSFQGLAKLAAPLEEGLAWKFAIDYCRELRIHLFHQDRGLSLFNYNGNYRAWAAYLTTRRAGMPQPETFVLTGSDGARAYISEVRYAEPVELRYLAGEVILSCGDVVLLRAPMADPPEEVYLEAAQLVLGGISLVREQDFPRPPPAPPIVAEIDEPAQLAWNGKLPEGAELRKLPDGAVELVGIRSKEEARMFTPLPKTAGLCFYDLKITAATAGGGVFLGREGEKPGDGVRFCQADQLMLGYRPAGENSAVTATVDKLAHISPLAGQPQWIRLLLAAGMTLKAWMSCDGEHWVPIYEPQRGVQLPATHLGLSCVAMPNDIGSRVRLAQIRVRQLPLLSALAPPELQQQAPVLPVTENYPQWLVDITRLQPAGVDAGAWRRACALRALAAGCTEPLGHTLLQNLLDDPQVAKRPLIERRGLLTEAALWSASPSSEWDNQVVWLVQSANRLAREAFEHGEPRPWTWIRPTIMTFPLARSVKVSALEPGLIRLELLSLLYADRWDDVLDLCRELKFFAGSNDHLRQFAPLSQWAEAVASRQTPRRAGAAAIAIKAEWQHPLIEELSKEAYNVLVEFQAALDSRAYGDACRIVASIDPSGIDGLLPTAKDRRHLTSLATAIALAMKEDPELAAAMNDQFGPVGRLRVRQAIESGDAAALELATFQFFGTEGAADAHRWLGDRALSAGEFAQALTHYRRAETTAAPALEPILAARSRLAAAMLGESWGQPVQAPVQIGETALEPAEFEALVAEMLRLHGGDAALPASAAATSGPDVPPPHGYRVERRGRLDGDVGDRPTSLPGDVRRFFVPWVERQMGTAAVGEVLYVNNRFQVSAYDLKSGQMRWRTEHRPGKRASAHEWSLVPMRPVIVGERIFARQLSQDGASLIAMDRASGNRLWIVDANRNQPLVSDPVWVQGKLYVFTTGPLDQNEMQLGLAVVDPATGQRLDWRPVVRLRDAWFSRRICQVTVAGDALVATLGGVTLACDTAGQVRWARRQVLMPMDDERDWVLQYAHPPLLDAGRLYVAQPGVRAVECLDPETGRLYWQATQPNLRRLLGIYDGRIYVQTDDQCLALDAATGTPRWRTPLPAPLDGALCGPRGDILLAVKEPSPQTGQKSRPRLVWLDRQTGAERGSAALDTLTDSDVRLGPLAVHEGRLWAFWGKNADDPYRDLVELVPDAPADPPPSPEEQNPWLRHLPPKLHAAAAEVLPGWVLLSGLAEGTVGKLADENGEKNILSVKTFGHLPVVLGKEVTVPAGQPRLALRMGAVNNQNWKLKVALGDNILLEKELLYTRVWHDFEVDLAPVAGQSGWLTVEARHWHGGDRTQSLWKRLEIVR